MENQITLKKDWKVLKEKYAVNNDQGLEFVDNLVSPSGDVVTLFACTEDDVRLYDKMLRDYKKITSNLTLLIASKIKRKDDIINMYVVREKISKNAICHMFFVFKNKLYAAIFNLKYYFPSTKKIMENNIVIKEFLDLLGE